MKIMFIHTLIRSITIFSFLLSEVVLVIEDTSFNLAATMLNAPLFSIDTRAAFNIVAARLSYVETTAQPTELPSASIQMWWIEDALSIGGVCQVIMQKAYP
jgi:hypothetical protein